MKAPSEGDLVEFRKLDSHPYRHESKAVCTEGVYAGGFEVSAMGESNHQRGGAVYLDEPTIWVGNAGTVPPAEFCSVRVCGVLGYGGGYGHLNAYEYQPVGPGE